MRQSKESVSQQPLSAKAYAWIALVAGLIGASLLFLYVYEVPRLVAGGIQDQFFYLLLFPWALSCATALFGAMRSYARLTYKQFGTALELGGPVVLFCLVVVGGFKLVPRSETFDLTVRANAADQPVITSGSITIDFDNLRRTEPINSNGEADFKGIAHKFWGVSLDVLPQVEGYKEMVQKVSVNSNVIDLRLERAPPPETVLKGTVSPLPGKTKQVKILIDGQRAEAISDDYGRFEIPVSGRDGDRVRVKVFIDGKMVYDDYQVLPGPVTLPVKSVD
ncbi:MAG TPA: hypothetical protein VGY31_14990 [Terriglobia bacterium]|nr:hypothetical protein [Terriglobia bacterium]